MNGRRFVLLVGFALIFGFPLPSGGQTPGTVDIRGRVVGDSTGSPLSNAHVFFSGSTIGTTTDDRGRYHFASVPPGAKRLYVTHLGYEAEQVDFVLPPDTSLTLSFRLEPTVIRAGTVTVADERDEEWYDHLGRFRRLFIGPSPAAEHCRFQNPRSLYFDTSWWGKFEAGATRPLQMENRALGYHVTYYLKEFEERGDIVRWDGDSLFEPLTPRDSAEAARWAANRREAFYGSLRHFLLALLHDRVEEEQFQMYHLPRAGAFRDWGRVRRHPISRGELIEETADSLYEISFNGALEVHYRGAGETEAYLEWADARRGPRDRQVSQIRLNRHPIHVDRFGEIVEPYGATLYQYFAYQRRLATLLPRGYRPPETDLRAGTLNP
jgi:hypothetical protein